MNLVLISSHIQYKNALEALELPGIVPRGRGNTCVFRFMPVEMKENSDFKVCDYPAQPRKKGIFKHFLFMLQLTVASLRLRNKVDTIIIGEVSARFMRYISILVNARQTIFVDDGMKSVYTFPCIGKYLPKNPITKRTLTKGVNVVTEYNVSPEDYDNYKLHTVARVNRIKGEYQIRENERWFIGQPLVEDGRISLEQYRMEVERQVAKYDKVKYFMHRRESLIKEELMRYENVEVVENQIPLEEYIDRCSFFPKEVIGFYSTALHFSFLRLPEAVRIISVKINVDDKVDEVYKYFSKIGIRVES